MGAWDVDDDREPLPLVGDASADVVVVGGGIAGLSTAYHLARRGVDVVLLEAGRVADGATGGSTGMVGPGVGDGVLDLRRTLGDERARRAVGATVDAVRLVVDLVKAERIDCGLVEGGQVHAALTPAHARRRWREAQAWRALGVQARWLEGDELARATGTRAYAGGVRIEPAGLVDPVRLCRGLRDAAMRRGARVHEQARVLGLAPGRVTTASGQVRAARVVVATNAWLPALGLCAREVVALHTRALVTRPLPAEVVRSLGGAGRDAVIDARAFFHYHRLTPDGRVLLGGAPVTTSAPDQGAWARLEAEAEALFPALAPLRVAARWSGRLAFTWDRYPLVGEVAPGLWALGGWCGHGLALGAWGGAAVAAALTGDAPLPALPWCRGRAPRQPERLGRVAVAVVTTALDLADRAAVRWPELARRVG